MNKSELSKSGNAYEMSVNLAVLDHLGLHLYSNRAAVLSEAVANSWDADATRVDIKLKRDDEGKVVQVAIIDNGFGMEPDDINKRFLMVGYRKRIEEGTDRTPQGRLVMGRKGIGKLSFFSVGGIIEVHSRKEGSTNPCGLVLNKHELDTAMARREKYYPKAIPCKIPEGKTGTWILISDVSIRRWGRTYESLQRKLARRFAVLGKALRPPFEVFVDQVQVRPAEREELKSLQFVWNIGDYTLDPQLTPVVKACGVFDGIVDAAEGWKISGWIGTAGEPKQLKDNDGEVLTGIVVMARGRLIQEDILKTLGSARLTSTYMIGEIQADFLDDTNLLDIATSDRQRISEEDNRYTQLKAYLKKVLNKISNDWGPMRTDVGAVEAMDKHPQLELWCDNLPAPHRRAARRMIGHIQGLPIEAEKDRIELYKAGVMAFERLKLREGWNELDFTSVENILRQLADRDTFEATLYRDIIRARVEVIEKFENLVDDNAKERVLQEYLFNHMWLLDASWEPATDDLKMEQKFLAEFYKQRPQQFRDLMGEDYDKAKGKRYDLRYKTISGQHVLVELKRASVSPSVHVLMEQGDFYRDVLAKCFNARVDTDKRSHISPQDIRLVFVVGPGSARKITEPQRAGLITQNAQVTSYDELINKAESSYREYLDRTHEVDKIESLMKQLEEDSKLAQAQEAKAQTQG